MVSRAAVDDKNESFIDKPLVVKKMEEKNFAGLTDDELKLESKKLRSRSVLNAFIIGFMIGIIIWSILKSTLGLLTLIPLYFIYKLANNSKNDKALKEVLKERGL